MARNYPSGGEPPADAFEVILRTDARVEDYFAGEAEPPGQ
jgi:hypothetical protein